MVSKIILFFRRNAGLTQEDMARFLNVDRSLISKYENGLVEPTFSIVNKMSEAFNVNCSILGLCLDLTNYSFGQAKAIVMSNDSTCETYFLPRNFCNTDGHPETLPKVLCLSDEEKNLVLKFLDSLHGQRVSSTC